MTAGCAGCGSCCDPVILPDDTFEGLAGWTTAALEGVPDPGTDEGWAAWAAIGYTDDQREATVNTYTPGSRYQADANFITGHWHPLGDHEYRCDRFDPATRLCGAHGDRPPVCQDYPWYGEEPAGRIQDTHRHCSFLADLPPGERPEGSRPLIPLMVING